MNTLKRDREIHLNDHDLHSDEANLKIKVQNVSKSSIYNFRCEAFFHGQILDFQLSQVFTKVRYAVLFFCGYDFTPQSRIDLWQIEESFSRFIEVGALPIVMTHDRAAIHLVYATPGYTSESLNFKPSYVMVSDNTDRLISTSFKSVNLDTLEMQRSVIILDSNLSVLFTHRVSPNRFFPMKSILNCFEYNTQ